MTDHENQTASRCIICNQLTDRTVDGQPSCDEHAALLYKDQLDEYMNRHQLDAEAFAVPKFNNAE